MARASSDAKMNGVMWTCEIKRNSRCFKENEQCRVSRVQRSAWQVWRRCGGLKIYLLHRLHRGSICEYFKNPCFSFKSKTAERKEHMIMSFHLPARSVFFRKVLQSHRHLNHPSYPCSSIFNSSRTFKIPCGWPPLWWGRGPETTGQLQHDSPARNDWKAGLVGWFLWREKPIQNGLYNVYMRYFQGENSWIIHADWYGRWDALRFSNWTGLLQLQSVHLYSIWLYTSFSLSNTLWFAGVRKILHTVGVQMTPSCLGGTWVSMELGTFIIVRYYPLGQRRCISTYRTTCSSYEPNSGGTSRPNAPPETWTLQCYARNMFQLFWSL